LTVSGDSELFFPGSSQIQKAILSTEKKGLVPMNSVEKMLILWDFYLKNLLWEFLAVSDSDEFEAVSDSDPLMTIFDFLKRRDD
jgi:hypothetical protein